MRVVLDTNVLVSAYVFPGGAPEDVYRLVLQGEVEMVTSRPLLVELHRVLTLKFGFARDRADEVVAQVLRLARFVEPADTVTVVADDPDDDRVLEAARAGEVDVIVSGDRHLRTLGSWEGVRILDPATFLAELRETG